MYQIQPSSGLLNVTYETVTSPCPWLKSLEGPYESNTFNVAVTALNRSGKAEIDSVLNGQVACEGKQTGRSTRHVDLDDSGSASLEERTGNTAMAVHI